YLRRRPHKYGARCATGAADIPPLSHRVALRVSSLSSTEPRLFSTSTVGPLSLNILRRVSTVRRHNGGSDELAPSYRTDVLPHRARDRDPHQRQSSVRAGISRDDHRTHHRSERG